MQYFCFAAATLHCVTKQNLHEFYRRHLQFLRRIKKGKQVLIAKKLLVEQQAILKLENKKEISSEKFDAFINALGITKAEALRLLELFTPPPPQNENDG